MDSAAGLFFDTVEEPADRANEPDAAALAYVAVLFLTVRPPADLLHACGNPIWRSGSRIVGPL